MTEAQYIWIKHDFTVPVRYDNNTVKLPKAMWRRKNPITGFGLVNEICPVYR